MQFRKPYKDAIRAGSVTRSFRLWQKPRARAGGRYNLHPEGAIEVTSIRTRKLRSIRSRDLAMTGLDSPDALRRELDCSDPNATVYQVDFHYLGPELVKQPDRALLSESELDELHRKLAAMDARSQAPWTEALLLQIHLQPATRAGDLAPVFGWPLARYKAQVRKLKALGLTVSLETGYRLSARGQQVLGESADVAST